ncbi:hypothetical protein ACFFUB_03435 [Algimonas porphyrae]
MLRFVTLSCAVLLIGTGQPSLAQDEHPMVEAQRRLSYVKTIKPPDRWLCKSTPRYATGVPMDYVLSMNFNFTDVAARIQSAAELEGKIYQSNIIMYGTGSANILKGTAKVVLNRAGEAQLDPLPSYAEWGDVSKDAYELSIVPSANPKSDKPYNLVGTRTSEFGIEDISCIAFPAPRPAVVSIPSPVDYLVSVKANQDHWRCDVDPAPVVKDSDGRILLRPDVYHINFRRLKSGQIAADIWSRPKALGSSYLSKFSKVAESPREDTTRLTFKAAYNIERDAAGPLGVFWSDPFSEVFQINIKPNPRANAKSPYVLTGAAQYEGQTWGKTHKGGETTFSCSVDE